MLLRVSLPLLQLGLSPPFAKPLRSSGLTALPDWAASSAARKGSSLPSFASRLLHRLGKEGEHYLIRKWMFSAPSPMAGRCQVSEAGSTGDLLLVCECFPWPWRLSRRSLLVVTNTLNHFVTGKQREIGVDLL